MSRYHISDTVSCLRIPSCKATNKIRNITQAYESISSFLSECSGTCLNIVGGLNHQDEGNVCNTRLQ